MRTAETIREEMSEAEQCFAAAIEFEQYGRAFELKLQIKDLFEELVRVIQAEDPYTTEADIRYFENIG